MSLDLVVNDAISSSNQTVQDQDGNASALQISSEKIRVQSSGANTNGVVLLGSTNNQNIASLSEGGSNNGNLLIYNTSGDLVCRLIGGNTTSWVMSNGGSFGVGTDAPAATLDVNGTLASNGTVAFTGIQPASKAPDSSKLEALFIDTDTGMLYYQ